MSADVNKYLEQSTENLVLMTLAGKQSAYEALVIRYERMVTASAKQIVRSEYMAQDAAQDAFVTAWLKLDTLAAPEKFGSWVARIAKNSAMRMAEKFRDYIDIDSFTGYESCFALPFEDSISSGEDYAELHDSINSLSDKVKKVICLYYFEGLSIAQIAARMSTSVGTVKRQLHDGRQKIRKDLCSMNETIDDTLVEKVMKKVAEFNLYWRFNDDKTDFAKSYKPLLEEVEALPESTKKNHALATVLQLGWWYSGEKSDEALARLKEAALNGKNEDAMETVMAIEHDKLSGKDMIDYMRNVQIPYLKENGMPTAQAYVWFWMGREYLNSDIMDLENATAAFNKTLELSEPNDVYYANALSALKLCAVYSESQRNGDRSTSAVAYDFRMYNGEQKLYSQPGFAISKFYFFYAVLYYATNTINVLSRSAAVGETIREAGHSASLLSITETVDTPAGQFENCELWEMDNRMSIYVKPGVGIVKCVSYESYDSYDILLGEYSIKSGSGKMPFSVGNSWVYVSSSHESVDFREEYEVICTDEDGRAVLSGFTVYERAKYDENSWKDMTLKLKDDYYAMASNADQNDWDTDGSMRTEIFNTLQRMQELAATPYEKHFTDRADSAMRRIITSNPNYAPDCKEVGLWNFFDIYRVSVGDSVKSLVEMDYHFEWKWWHDPAYMLEHNCMLEELGNCGAVWDDDWKPGYSGESVTCPYGRIMTTAIKCEDGGTVTTEAGRFENCLKVTLDISGSGYMRGKKEYFFAKGIGIVRCIHHVDPAVYELSSYEGIGEGYMPLEDGIVRHYKGVDFPNGMRGEIDFACAADEHGQLTVIVDQIGQQSREEWDKSDQPEQLLAKK